MSQPTIYPEGSYDSTYNLLQSQQNYGNADTVGMFRDAFQAALNSTTRSGGPPLLSYPIDLGSAPEYQFSIRFDIYQTGGATLQRARSRQDSIAAAIVQSVNQAEGSLSVGQFVDLAGAAIDPIFDLVGSSFGGANSNIGNVDQLGKGRDSFVEESLGLKDLTEFVGTIYMYLPGSISIGYKFEYEDADLSSLDILKGLRSLTETQTGAGGVAQAEIARKMGMSAIKVADSITELVGGKDVLERGLAASQRQVQNPFVVHMFKGVGRRTFRFAFTMIPRSELEARSIDNIVRMFRKFSHPKRSEGGRFLDFPAEFGISFLYQNQENIRLPKIRKCALTGINLNYGENTFTTTKPDAQGMVNPTKITMELEFSELELLTQQSIEEQGA